MELTDDIFFDEELTPEELEALREWYENLSQGENHG